MTLGLPVSYRARVTNSRQQGIIVNLIERIASYSNNIAESITFVVQGEIVKHKKNMQ